MIKVSIIIPIYNVEKFLDECVRSVLNQTYTNLEIILVDDGSPDRCPIMCDEYAKQDSRIKVIHQINGGLSAARNSGMEIATGEYVYFLDSDDKIFPYAIETMVDRIIENPNVDVVAASFINQYGSSVCYYDPQRFLSYTDNKKWIHEKFCKWEISLAAWNKLYRKVWLENNHISFPEGYIHEDVYWSFYVQKHINTIAFVEKNCYWYRLSNDKSITNEIDRTKSCIAHLHIIEFIERDVIDELGVEFLKPISSYKFWSVYYPLCKNKKLIKNTCRDIYKNIKQRNPSSLFLKEFSIITAPHWMISNWCFYSYRAYKKLLKILMITK